MALVDSHLAYWPKFLLHKVCLAVFGRQEAANKRLQNKQRLTRLTQGIVSTPVLGDLSSIV